MNFSDWESSLKDIRPSTPAWRGLIGAINGDTLSDTELAAFRTLAKREPPEGGASEAIIIGGRRSAKSETAARWLIHQAIHGNHGMALAQGQKGILAVLSAERAMSREILAYCKGLLSQRSVRRFVAEEREESIDFTTQVSIRILTADSTSVRSGTIVGCVLDEACFLSHEPSADPDTAIVEALRPGLAPVIGAAPRRMLCISSAGVRHGWIYDQVTAYHGVKGAPILVAVGRTIDLNPNIDPAYLERRRKSNPTTYAREHDSEFSDCVSEGWLGLANISRATDVGRGNTEYELGLRYFLAVDVGFANDSTAICAATSRYIFTDPARTKRERRTDLVYVDRMTPKPDEPVNVQAMIERVRRACELYSVSTVYIDQFSSSVLVELFRSRGIRAIKTPWTAGGEDSKLQRFTRVREALADGSLRLPDNPTLLSEVANIRGTALPGGGTKLEASYGSDDVAHAAIMSISLALAHNPSWPAKGGLTPSEKEVYDNRITDFCARNGIF